MVNKLIRKILNIDSCQTERDCLKIFSESMQTETVKLQKGQKHHKKCCKISHITHLKSFYAV